ncbi:MAG: hypothetical protein WA705_15610 [Candidatus Ozemobacteraceae bacterium]
MQQTLKESPCTAPFFPRTLVTKLLELHPPLELRRSILRADGPHLSASFRGDDDLHT